MAITATTFTFTKTFGPFNPGDSASFCPVDAAIITAKGVAISTGTQSWSQMVTMQDPTLALNSSGV